MKKIHLIIILVVLILIGVGFYLSGNSSDFMGKFTAKPAANGMEAEETREWKQKNSMEAEDNKE